MVTIFLTMGCVLAVISCFCEVKLVHGSKTIRNLYTHGLRVGGYHIDAIWFNTAGSLLLSAILGMIFSADGLVVMFGGIISTGLSQMWFMGEEFFQRAGITKSSITQMGSSIRAKKDSAVQLYNDFKQPIIDIKNATLFVLRVITFPFVCVRRISAAYTARKAATC